MEAPIPAKETFTGPTSLWGEPVEAEYVDVGLDGYAGNPLIEALGPIHSSRDAMRLLCHLPKVKPSERSLPAQLRAEAAFSVLEFNVPTDLQVRLFKKLKRVIRFSYRGRNPTEVGYWSRAEQRVLSLNLSGRSHLSQVRRGLQPNFAIVAFPGMGKSAAIEAVLGTMPQWIAHYSYRGRPFRFDQLVHIKVDCPHDGSIKQLCHSILIAVDRVFGTDYFGLFTKGDPSAARLVPYIARVVQMHALGVLVIDEIQNLNEARSGGAREMLNFLVRLSNELRVPIVMIGTPRARKILARALHSARRADGAGSDVWFPFKKQDGDWRVLIEQMWKYQYLRNYQALTPEISARLHHHSAGIPDFAVKLFLLAQVRAIETGTETITPLTLDSVAADEMKFSQPILRALREPWDQSKLERIASDVVLIDDDELALQIEEAKMRMEADPKPERVAPSTARRGRSKRSQTPSPSKSKSNKGGSRPVDMPSTKDLRSMKNYEAIKQAGLIGASNGGMTRRP